MALGLPSPIEFARVPDSSISLSPLCLESHLWLFAPKGASNEMFKSVWVPSKWDLKIAMCKKKKLKFYSYF